MTTILSRYEDLHPGSARLHPRASALFPDGVTHDLRRLSPFPLYAERASGSKKVDVDGNEIIDYVMGHGALLLGHSHPAIVRAVTEQVALGTHYGSSHEGELRWGELVTRMVPSAQRVRFTSSGTEATMMALRLARAYTGREKVIRLEEHFHGWSDALTGQPRPEETLPSAPGIPHGLLEATIVLPANDGDALQRVLQEDGSDVAAIIIEATGAHWGELPIDVEYVALARELSSRHGALLILDEVITGFRVTPGGAQQAYNILPDLTTMAKILGGGLPGACVAGRAEIVDQIAASHGADRVAHPGTFNANPLSAAAGVACLSMIEDGTHQERAASTAATIARGMNAVFREAGVVGSVYGQASMLHIAPGMETSPPDGYSWGWHALPTGSVTRRAAIPLLRLAMLNEGVDLMGDGLMVSSAHTDADANYTIEAFRRAVLAMQSEGALP